MEVRNCRMCRRLFNYLGGKNICPVCKDALEKKFLAVRDYIRENPTSGLQKIADDNEIDVQQVRDWIKEGRLEISKGGPISLSCEKCGAPILKGRFCDNCNKNMANNLSKLVEASTRGKMPPLDASKKAGPGMHFKKS